MKQISPSLLKPFSSVALLFVMLAAAPQDMRAAQSFASVQPPVADKSFSTQAVSTSGSRGFEIVPMQSNAAASFKQVDKLVASEAPIVVPTDLVTHYYTAADMARIAEHDVWPNQSWVLVDSMPWPTSMAEILALRPIPVLRGNTMPEMPVAPAPQQAAAGAPPSPPPAAKVADNTSGMPVSVPPPPPIPTQGAAHNGPGSPVQSSVLPVK